VDSETLEVVWDGTDVINTNHMSGLGWLTANIQLFGIDLRSVVLGTICIVFKIFETFNFLVMHLKKLLS
jgi:hypothetical protein